MADIFKVDGADLLIKAIIAIDNEKDCKLLLEDLMTSKEIIEISQRLEVVDLLKKGLSYVEICEKTGVSTATISRVNRCLTYGNGGYKTVFDKIITD